MQIGPLFGLVAVILTAITAEIRLPGSSRHRHPRARRQPPAPRVHAAARGRLDGRERALDARVRRHGDGRRRGPARPRVGPLRGRDDRRSRGWLRARGPGLDDPRPDRLPRERARLPRRPGHLPLRGRGTGCAGRAAPPADRTGGAATLELLQRAHVVAARADVDRAERGARPLHVADALPARAHAGPAFRGPAARRRLLAAHGRGRVRGRRDHLLRRALVLGRPLQADAPDEHHLLRHRRRGAPRRLGAGAQPQRRRVRPAADPDGHRARGRTLRAGRRDAGRARPARRHVRGLPRRPRRDHGPVQRVPRARPDRGGVHRRRRGRGLGVRRHPRRDARAPRGRAPPAREPAPFRGALRGLAGERPESAAA